MGTGDLAEALDVVFSSLHAPHLHTTHALVHVLFVGRVVEGAAAALHELQSLSPAGGAVERHRPGPEASER